MTVINSTTSRQNSIDSVTQIIRNLNGTVLSQSIVEGISYHGLLAELPANAIKNIINNKSTELTKCENIMFFRPVGQMVVGENVEEENTENITTKDMQFPNGDPIIALFDGLPLANHRLLEGRLQIDDPDNWADEYPAAARIHGTSMASLISHGDLNESKESLNRPIYVRPIMKAIPEPDWVSTPPREGVPEDVLIVDLVHKAVRRMFEDTDEEAVAPQIKIINLSIGDPSRQFTNSMSPLARLVDWLSVKYKILFIISAGNQPAPITLSISQETYKNLEPVELEEKIIKALYKDSRNRKLLSPAESINGITVGAAHYDTSSIDNMGNRFNPFMQVLPSPISAFGRGYRKSIKPDIIFNGGRQLYRTPINTTTKAVVEPAIFKTSPGNKTASPSSQSGNLLSTSYSCGTSNATALMTRSAGICYDSLQQIFNEQDISIDSQSYEVPLLKAMLVHGCKWSDCGTRLKEILSTPDNNKSIKSIIGKWSGYGFPDVDQVLSCTEQRATLLGFGELSDGEGHVFRLPLPPSLSAKLDKRRLTVTLAWLSPISVNTQKYRTASLWFDAKNSLAPTRSDANHHAVKRGTLQHEIFEGVKAEPFKDGDFIEIKINCRNDAGKITAPIAYGLVVSLDVAEGTDIAIYNEIRSRITPTIQIQQITDTL